MASEKNMIHLKDYRATDYLVENIFLDIDLHEDQTVVKAAMSFYRNPSVTNFKPVLNLHGEKMELLEISIDGQVLDASQYQVDDESLVIEGLPESFKLATTVRIHPESNTQLSGLYQSGGNFCTQCESHGFRRITYFYDRPDVMTRFTTCISGDKARYPSLLSNGNLIDQKDLGDGRHWVKWEDPSLKPSYLFALVAGDFDLLEDKFVTCSGRRVALQLFVEKGFKDQGPFAIKSLKRAMKWDEEAFGREYDLDIYMIVAISDFNMGAMENKGLNVFNTKCVLANPETATDQDFVRVESVIGHEYFHNWSGNRVTCRDWFQITLKEGLTVFRDQSFTADMLSAAVARIDDVNELRLMQFPQDAGPTAHPIRPEAYIEINNFYTATVYNKGAEVIRMIQTLIGKKKFREAMDLYFSRYDGQAVTTEDFTQAMQDVSGFDLTQFKRWYRQAGTPVLTCASSYDVEKQQFHLTVTQSCPKTPGQNVKEPFVIPLAMGLVDSSGNDIPLQLLGEPQVIDGTKVLVIDKPEQTFVFENVSCEPLPSLLRHFSAPVILQYPFASEQLVHLWLHDSDAFNRWESGQRYLSDLILNLAKMPDQFSPLPEELINAYRTLLTTDFDDLQLQARLLSLPSEHYIIQQMTVADVDAVHAARDFVKNSLAIALHDEWMAIYKKHHDSANYKYSAEAIGKRAIKNCCLDFAVVRMEDIDCQLAFDQFKSSKNMTDTMGALNSLNHTACALREEALEDFYKNWKHDPLVVDKWFTLQALYGLSGTFDRVKELLNHPDFDRGNPNRVRSLVGAFCQNLIYFHAKDGSGYQFLADQVLIADEKNAQLASRLVEPLVRWQKFDESRQLLMKKQLERILATKDLSKDVYELAARSLDPEGVASES